MNRINGTVLNEFNIFTHYNYPLRMLPTQHNGTSEMCQGIVRKFFIRGFSSENYMIDRGRSNTLVELDQ